MRKLMTRLTRRALFAVVAGALAACAGGGDRTSPATGSAAGSGAAASSAQQLRTPVPVALLVPLTNANARVAADGAAIANAARMALSERGGELIDLRVFDTRGDAAGAAGAAAQATGGGARLILGPLFGANTPAVGEVARNAGTHAISFSTDTAVAGGPVFISGFTPEGEVRRILGYAARQGITNVGVYAPEVPYGEAALRGVRRYAAESGVRIVAEATYPRSFQDIERTVPAFVAEAQGGGAQALLLPDFGEGLPTVASFVDFHGMPQPSTRYLGIGQWAARSTLNETTLQGGWFAGADPDATASFSARYRVRFGDSPPFVAVLGYDAASMAVELVSEAIATRSADPFTREAITRPQGFRGGVGAFRFRPDGQVERGLAVLEVGVGSFLTLEPAVTSFGAGS